MSPFRILFGLLLLALTSTGASAEKRVALVIGNGAYAQAGILANPANDARAVAGALERLGFEVLLAVDATQKEMLSALDRYAGLLAGAEAAVFFYAGHGIQIGGENFLLPVDVSAETERAIRYGAIDVGEVVADMETNAAVSLVVLDACRNNPFVEQLQRSAKSRSAGIGRGLALIKPRSSGTIIAFAAAAGEVASDGVGENSPYTTALLKEIEAPGVEVALVFRRVAGHVIKATNGAQQPELLVRLVNEFYLKPLEASAPPPVSSEAEAGAAPSTQSNAEAAALEPEETTELRQVIARPQWAHIAPREPAGAVWQPPAGRTVSLVEPNNGPATAAIVGVNDMANLEIQPRGDEDWLALDIAAAGALTLELSEAPAQIDLAARVLDGDLRVVQDWQTAPRPGGGLRARFDLPGPGRYYLVLADSHHDAEAAATLRLQLGFTASADLRETNGTIGAAWPIAANGEVEASIFPRGDFDWYHFWVDAPGLLSVSVNGAPPELDLAMRLHNADGQVIHDWTVAPRPGGDLAVDFDLKQPGAYFLEVADSYSDAWSPAAYRMVSRFTPSADHYEPNDSFAEATVVPAKGRHRLTVLPRGDVDWLRFDVDHPGELTIAAREVPERLDIAFRVYNHDKAVIADWVRAPRPGGDTTAVVDLPAAGTYVIEIADGNHDQREIASYIFETSFTPQPDQYEPNNGPGQATPMRATGEILFNILPRGDTDWFSVDVGATGELALTIDESPPDLDLYFRVWNADRLVVRDWVAPYSKGGLTEGYADLPAAGLYFVEVADGNHDARSVQHATLSSRFVAAADSHEPNGSFGSAAPVPLAGSARLHILPRGDTDWLSIAAPEPGTLAITVDEVPEPLDLVFRIHDANGVAGAWNGPFVKGGGGETRVVLPAAGTYRIEIADSNHDARSPLPFSISWTFGAGQ